MPNQRNPNRRKLQAWLWVDDMTTLEQLAKDEGLSLKEALELIIKESKGRKRGRRNDDK